MKIYLTYAFSPIMARKYIRRIVGVMSGTSGDGVDGALIEVTGSGWSAQVKILKTASISWGATSSTLKEVSRGKQISVKELAVWNRFIGESWAEVIEKLCEEKTPDLIVLSGHTIYHRPPYSLQWGNPWQVAVKFKVPVLYDLRSRDIAEGGEGAPITPLADFVLFRDSCQNVSVVNLGGFINVTYIPKRGKREKINDWALRTQGKDICICNRLLDRIAQILLGQECDLGGESALRGEVLPLLDERITDLLRQQASANRSLGSGDDLLEVEELLEKDYSVSSILRTICRSIAKVLSENLPSDGVVIVAGGGVKNKALMEEFSRFRRWELSDSWGIPFRYREAVAMAVLGMLIWDGHPLTLPSTTHTPHPLSGGSWLFPYDYHSLKVPLKRN